MRVVNLAARSIDYRLNILGIRVWEESCQLIAMNAQRWDTLGPRWDLPVQVPRNPAELKAAAADTLRMTAYQYNVERPGSDIVDVLARLKNFDAALANTSTSSAGLR